MSFMRNTEFYFIDKNGYRIPDKEKSQSEDMKHERVIHDEIVLQIFEKNPELKKEYSKSGIQSPSTFLMLKGYLHVIENISTQYMSIMYSSLSISEQQEKKLRSFMKEGAQIHDIIMEDLQLDKNTRECIREHLKEGCTVDYINQTFIYPAYKKMYTSIKKIQGDVLR